MNILVTGANGQLGNEMRVVAQNSTDNYIFTDVTELDITDALAVEKTIRNNNINVVINCAFKISANSRSFSALSTFV